MWHRGRSVGGNGENGEYGPMVRCDRLRYDPQIDALQAGGPVVQHVIDPPIRFIRRVCDLEFTTTSRGTDKENHRLRDDTAVRHSVQVTGNDDGRIPALPNQLLEHGDRCDPFPVIRAVVQMSGEEDELLTSHSDMDLEQPPLLVGQELREAVVLVPLDRQPAQDGVSVLAALTIDVLFENSVQARPFGQPCRLVNSIGPFHAPINFLEGDQIGFGLVDDLGDAFDVDPAVHAFAMVDVVGQHADCGRLMGYASRQTQGGDRKNDDSNTSQPVHVHGSHRFDHVIDICSTVAMETQTKYGNWATAMLTEGRQQ